MKNKNNTPSPTNIITKNKNDQKNINNKSLKKNLPKGLNQNGKGRVNNINNNNSRKQNNSATSIQMNNKNNNKSKKQNNSTQLLLKNKNTSNKKTSNNSLFSKIFST